uniref:Spike glycoprotein G central domain-containing protein n=1 Tax=Glossina austeni TaxID=7395 RepID=A0A1A9UR89_GLOAU
MVQHFPLRADKRRQLGAAEGDREWLSEHAKLCGEDFWENSFKESCRLSLGRRISVSFADGDWAQAQFTHAKTVSKIMWWKNVTLCSSDINLRVSHQYERDQHFIESVMALMFYERCQDISKIRNNERVPPMELSYLAQKYPAMWPAYLIMVYLLYLSIRKNNTI